MGHEVERIGEEDALDEEEEVEIVQKNNVEKVKDMAYQFKNYVV